ncbi:hypothetical protein OIU76_000084 [Salix suchowensis]|nr:hypothetical protein OIU76_000084 [Salix suchowensis]
MDEENTRSLKKMRFSLMGFPISFLKKGVQNRDIALKIKAINEKLDEIAKEKAMYGFELYKVADHQLPRLTSTSLVDEWSVCGRDGEKKSVVSKLLAESSQEAQDVELEGSTPNLAVLQSLLQRASQSIKGMRVLLVLDDVWTEDYRQWERLKPSLTGCARGSRILVTTRNGAVAKMMGTNQQIDIQTLSDDALDGSNHGEASVETSTGRVRHLSIMLSMQTSFPSSIHRAKGLRSLLIGGYGWDGAAVPDVMKQLTCIRSLNVSRSLIKEIPKEIGKLIHLRHLNLEWCEELVSLPETMCDLCNLQSLDVIGCRSLKELPRATVKLIKLRHLCISGSGVAFMPKGIERLTSLRTLDCFSVCGGGENESKAANLRELKNLDHIRGSLVIKNLQGGGIEDAAEAQLKNKKRLLCLHLNFKADEGRLGGIEDSNLIEVLQPPSDLERLHIFKSREWEGPPRWTEYLGPDLNSPMASRLSRNKVGSDGQVQSLGGGSHKGLNLQWSSMELCKDTCNTFLRRTSVRKFKSIVSSGNSVTMIGTGKLHANLYWLEKEAITTLNVVILGVVRRRDIALKIKEVSEKVDEIANERAKYGLQINRATDHELQRPTSTHFFDESSVSGRDGEKKSVVSMLLAESSQEAQNVDVISLVGLGGIGKTTPAQLAFNDAEVRTHFEKKIWVCVSEPFDEWEQMKQSLASCARGSRILVTTRKGEVATMIGTDHRIDIKTLSDDACGSIFNHVAFYKRSKEERERVEDIGNKIATKCKGLPLVAKVLGGLMQSKRTREEWEDVLSSELWGLDEVDKDKVEKEIFLPLLLSYYDLPSVVRRCFLYCCMFPKDYTMRKDELVKMWMAQGYLKETRSRDMEVVGEYYFQVLAARSFFQDIKKNYIEEITFKMHDIVHDFAQYMTENECLTVDGNNLGEASVETSIGRVRHLSMMLSMETSFPSSIHRAKGLRSVLIGITGYRWDGAALPDVMKKLTCIRSLNLSESSIEEIPKVVGKLIHLRHLNLKDCIELVSLPETMCDLCNLQSLDVTGCSSLKELPRATVKLVNLRHLCIDGSGVAFMPKGIERLTCLRTLDCFIVCGGGENESKAANLRELKNLNHIGGRLKIRNLQGGGIEDAAEAQLKNKKRLLCFKLNFCNNHEDDILIEALQPPSDLEKLYISGFEGQISGKNIETGKIGGDKQFRHFLS